MNEGGWIVALWAAMVPLVVMVLLFVPPYAGAVGTLYMVHGDAVDDIWGKVSVVFKGVRQLYDYWEQTEEASFYEFFLPTFAPFIGGILVSLLGVRWFFRYVRSVFSL